jgi:hypothetical protein
MRPALDPVGHRVPRTKPTCILHTWRPHRRRPFVLVLHLHQHQSSRNLHLHYLAKNQSTQRCQSLITQGSDHPPVLEPHVVLSSVAHQPLSHHSSPLQIPLRPSLHWSRWPFSIRPYDQAPSPLCSHPSPCLRRSLLPGSTSAARRLRAALAVQTRRSNPPSAKAEAAALAPDSEFTAARWAEGVYAPTSPYTGGRSSPCPRRRLHLRRSHCRHTCPPCSIRFGGRATTARSSTKERSARTQQPHHIHVLDGGRELARRMASPPAPRRPPHPTSDRAAAPCPDSSAPAFLACARRPLTRVLYCGGELHRRLPHQSLD